MKAWELKKAIKIWGFPSNTKFEGYVVHLPETDEFLAKHNSDSDGDLWGWTPIPDYAIKYKKLKDAQSVIDAYDKTKAVIGRLLDVGPQHIVVLPEQMEELRAEIH